MSLRYTDPSGHGACDGPYQAPECSQIANSDNKVPAPGPTLVDIEKLDPMPGVTGISGRDFYQWYLALYRDTTGWWWNVFGQDASFTIWEAIAVILVFEANGNWSNSYLAEAMVRAASTYGCGGGACTTTEQFLNHFARRCLPPVLPPPMPRLWNRLFSCLPTIHPVGTKGV